MVVRVGLRDAFRLMASYQTAIEAAEPDLSAASIESPWTPSPTGLESVVWADLLGVDYEGPLTRAAAMAVPAVARNRHLVAGTIARLPLALLTGDTRQPAPTWMTRTDQALPPYHRMLWTIDDLIFYGWSLWTAHRVGGQLLSVERVPWERWDTDTAGRIRVDGEYVNDPSRLIAIPGPHEGICHFGATSLRLALDNLATAATAARNPSAYLELHDTGDTPMADEEITALVGRWAAARQGKNGGVAYTNRTVELKEHGSYAEHLLIEGRNADAVDVARMVSNPASMGDATNAGASLTYETSQGRNSEFIDYGIGLYLGALEARLSMDDVVPTGQRVAFDTAAIRDLDAPDTGPTRED